MNKQFKIIDGWLRKQNDDEHITQEHVKVSHVPTSHFESRDEHIATELLVVHNISLPPGEFGNDYISDLFTGCLDKDAHPYFADIYNVRVSAHCLIKRTGEIVQYVSFNDKAWHAGISNYNGKEKCNDFSIGIELEGTDDIPYTDLQYLQLAKLTCLLKAQYPDIKDNIVGHNDIAPGRKTDPGPSFNWQHFTKLVADNA